MSYSIVLDYRFTKALVAKNLSFGAAQEALAACQRRGVKEARISIGCESFAQPLLIAA